MNEHIKNENLQASVSKEKLIPETVALVKQKLDELKSGLDAGLCQRFKNVIDNYSAMGNSPTPHLLLVSEEQEKTWFDMNVSERLNFVGSLTKLLETLNKYKIHPRFDTTLVYVKTGESIQSEDKRSIQDSLSQLTQRYTEYLEEYSSKNI